VSEIYLGTGWLARASTLMPQTLKIWLSAKDPMRDDAVPDQKGLTYRVMRGGGWGKRTPRNPSLTRGVGGAPKSRDLDLSFRVSVGID
jgi:hypothetical protein